MMRSLYSGVSGLKVHQTRMDVIGNNISNVNTIGFKSSNVVFSDILYQTLSSASGANVESGRTGTNAKQVGLGASLSSITATVSASGSAQRTDNPFDLMIEGDGFFIVNNGSGNLFTRAGSFTVDANGTLCNYDGYAVMGWQTDPLDETRIKTDLVSPLRIMTAENMYAVPEPTKAVHFTGNIDSADTAFDSESGKLTSFAFYDNLGRNYTVNLRLKQAVDGTTMLPIENQYEVRVTDILDSSGTSILATFNKDTGLPEAVTGITFNFGGTDYTPEVKDGELVVDTDDPVYLTFNPVNGKFAFVSDEDDVDEDDWGKDEYCSVNFKMTGDHDGRFLETGIDVDFSSMTMFAKSGKTKIEPKRGNLEGKLAGRMAGNLKGISADESGMLYGVYDNGTQRLLGQIVVTEFANPAGLESVGGSLFAATQNSGEFDGIGQDVTATGGSFNPGTLEMSNVDLSTEFMNMITTQRGFQANSRTITVSDTMLEELINLKR